MGGRKVEHLKANVEALTLELSMDDVAEIEKGYDFDIGFPHNMVNFTGKVAMGPEDVVPGLSLGQFDYVAPQSAIKPHKGGINVACKV